MSLLACSILFLLLTSYPMDALIGNPLVHPGVLSLCSSVAVGLLITTFDKDQLFRYTYNIIVGWGAINFLFWVVGGGDTRLGFLDSQVIYAAFLFAIGIILGCWHFMHQTLPRRYVVSSSLFLLLCLLLSQTRAAIILLAIYLLFTYRAALIPKRKAVAGIAVGVVVIVIGFSSYFSRLIDYSYMAESVTYRASLIGASLPASPSQLLIGGGIGSIEDNIHAKGQQFPALAEDIKDGIIFESSHNYYADILVERGAIVLILFLLLLVVTLRHYKRSGRHSPLIWSVVVFSLVYLLVNNINIQMELILWVGILLLVFDPDKTPVVDS